MKFVNNSSREFRINLGNIHSARFSRSMPNKTFCAYYNNALLIRKQYSIKCSKKWNSRQDTENYQDNHVLERDKIHILNKEIQYPSIRNKPISEPTFCTAAFSIFQTQQIKYCTNDLLTDQIFSNLFVVSAACKQSELKQQTLKVKIRSVIHSRNSLSRYKCDKHHTGKTKEEIPTTTYKGCEIC